jgi:hypothetical protein
MIGKSSLNSAESLPASDEAMAGGTKGSVEGVSKAALKRGFTHVPEAEAATDPPETPPVTEGFLSRPRGWER